MERVVESLRVVSVAALGAWLGLSFRLPLGPLIGATLAVTVAGKMGMRWNMPPVFVATVQLLLGISVGSCITAPMVRELTDFRTLLGLVSCMSAQILVGYKWLRQKEKWGHVESLLGSIPGAMAAVMTVVQDGGAASGRVAFVHIFRLLALLLVVTVIADGRVETTISPSSTVDDFLGVLPAAVAAIVTGRLLERLDVPAPYMLTGLICSTAINISPLSTGIHMPEILTTVALVLLGSLIGLRLRDITAREFLEYTRAGLIVTMLTFGTTSIIALAVSVLTGRSFLVLFFSWAPGGVELVAAAAVLMKLDPAFVMLNHVVRMSIINLSPAFLPKSIFREKASTE